MSVSADSISRFSDLAELELAERDITDTSESDDEDRLRLYIDESTIIESQKYTDDEYEAMDNRLLELIKSCH